MASYRVLKSAALQERRSERRSQNDERERERRSARKLRAGARAPLGKTEERELGAPLFVSRLFYYKSRYLEGTKTHFFLFARFARIRNQFLMATFGNNC